MFSQKLHEQMIEKKSRLCVGLDPRIDLLPKRLIQKQQKALGATSAAIGATLTEFGKEVVELVAPYAVCLKLQSAFYELWGADGMDAFWQTATYAQQHDLLVIADVKRGDIASTAVGYAHSYLGGHLLFRTPVSTPFDAMTLNPFLGRDSIDPCIEVAEKENKGLFVLVKTSNPGSTDIQDQVSQGKTISQHVIDMITSAKLDTDTFGYHSVGAVIGATHKEAARAYRHKLPHSILLVPGIGAQGADPQNLPLFFDKDHLGALITASRSITSSFDPSAQTYADTIRKAAAETHNMIEKVLNDSTR